MRTKRWVINLVAMFCMVAFLLPIAPALAEVQEVPDGTTLHAGAVGVFETIDNNRRTIRILGGRLNLQDFPVGKNDQLKIENNAWTGYDDHDLAQEAMSLATARRSQFSGYDVSAVSALPALPTPAPTATPLPPQACSPRPKVGTQVTKRDDGGFDVLLTAGAGGLLEVRVLSNNASLRGLGNRGDEQSFTYPVPNNPHTLTFQMYRRGANNAPLTVQMEVVDGCGAWPTFVGHGGASSGPPTTPTPVLTPVPTPTPRPTDVGQGVTLQKNEVALAEVIDFTQKRITIFGGVLPKNFRTIQTPEGHLNARIGYVSAAAAESAACDLRKERQGQSFFAGYSISCGNVPIPDSWVERREVTPDGTVLAQNTIGVAEEIDYTNRRINLFGGRFPGAFTVYRDPATARENNAWVNYESERAAQEDAHRQVIRRRNDSFFDGYTITVNSP